MSKFLVTILLLFTLGVISECKSIPEYDENSLSLVSQNHSNYFEEKDEHVDCFGMGSLVAKILQWLFQNKPTPEGDKRVKFLVHSRMSKVPYRLYVEENQFEIEYSSFKPERQTVFIVHGFLAHGEENWIQKMTDGYLALDDVNVIAVDWSRYSNILNYYKAVVNAKNAADEITKFMELVYKTYPATDNWGNIHMIGHSLGAHVSGMVAEKFKELKSEWRITRVTGLDPAQPCFAASPLSLSKNDAPFVDIIHTNGKLIAGMGLGLKKPIGHVDFYANGGQRQPGCWKKASIWDAPRAGIMEAVCSHRRSYEYFTESLQLEADKLNNKFWGHEWDLSPQNAAPLVGKDCDSNICVEMGINAHKYPQRGVFFVSTGTINPHVVITESDRLDILEQLKLDSSKKSLIKVENDDNDDDTYNFHS